jgi:hypothetical protein
VELAYIAHSERCALLLDRDGVCRWAVPKADANDEMVVAAKRCIGAQFVASLDPDAPGFMASEPRIGRNMLFALIVDGRAAILRFGPLQAFEKLDAPASSVDVAPAPPAAPSAEAVAAAVVEAERESAAQLEAEDEPHETIDASAVVILDGPIAPAIETTSDVTQGEPEPEPIVEAKADPQEPATVAKAPDLDDMLASFAREPLEEEPIVIEDEHDPSDVEEPTIEAKHKLPLMAADDDDEDDEDDLETLSRAIPGATGEIPLAIPAPPDSTSAVVTSAFARIEVREERPRGRDVSPPRGTDLDALLAKAATPQAPQRPVRNFSRSGTDGVEVALSRITELTSSDDDDDVEEIDDSQLDVVTMAFAREGGLEALDFDVDVETSELTAEAAEAIAKNPLAGRDASSSPRPSGFMRRTSEIDEDSTSPFARASGDKIRQPSEPDRTDLFDLGRRGMLPRR